MRINGETAFDQIGELRGGCDGLGAVFLSQRVLVGRLLDQHFTEDDPIGEDIRRGRIPTVGDFRRHVEGRSRVGVDVGVIDVLGEAEVTDFKHAVEGNKNIRGLQVAVHEVASVHELKSLNDLSAAFDGVHARINQRRKRLVFQVHQHPQRDVDVVPLALHNAAELHNVRVAELRKKVAFVFYFFHFAQNRCLVVSEAFWILKLGEQLPGVVGAAVKHFKHRAKPPARDEFHALYIAL